MSEYDMSFAKKLLSDEDFDTIFGAEMDNQLMSSVLKEEDEFILDDPDACGIEDDYGKIGAGTGLGSDLGEDHETKGAFAAKGDTSDQDIIASTSGETFSKGKELHSGDNAQGKVTDGHQPNGDFHVAGDDSDAIDKTFEQGFLDAYAALMEEVNAELGLENPPVDTPTPVPDIRPSYGPEDGGNYTDELDNDSYDDDVDYYDSSDFSDYSSDEDEEDEEIIDDCGTGSCAPTGMAPSTESYNYFDSLDILSEMDDQIATEERDPCKIEDKGDNLGDDIGPGHDKNGVSKPCCDTSDMDIIDAVSGGTFADDCQYNSGDNAQGKVTDGHQPNGDFHVAGDDDKSSDDSFSEKGSLLDREDDYEDLIMNDVDDTPEKKLSSSELEKLNANEDDELMLGLI